MKFMQGPVAFISHAIRLRPAVVIWLFFDEASLDQDIEIRIDSLSGDVRRVLCVDDIVKLTSSWAITSCKAIEEYPLETRIIVELRHPSADSSQSGQLNAEDSFRVVNYAVAVPQQGKSFTEFYVLTENETGELVADDYPTEFETGESKPIHVGIGNHEHRDLDYTVVVTLQRVQTENNTTAVLEERELQRLQASVPDNETWHRELNLTPTMEGQRLRLAFLLYQDDPPAQPTVDNAYRELHLWVNVTAPASTQTLMAPSGPPTTGSAP